MHSHELLQTGSFQRIEGDKNIASQEELYKEAKAHSKSFAGKRGELKVRKRGK